MTSPINCIPAEILVEIFSVADRWDWNSAALVCRKWRDIIDMLVRQWAVSRTADDMTSSDLRQSKLAPAMWSGILLPMHDVIPSANELLLMPLTTDWPWRQVMRRRFAVPTIDQIMDANYTVSRCDSEIFQIAMRDFIAVIRRSIVNPAVALVIIDEFIGAVHVGKHHELVMGTYYLSCLFTGENDAQPSKMQKIFTILFTRPRKLTLHGDGYPPNIAEIMAADSTTRELVIVAMFMTGKYSYAQNCIRELVLSTPIRYANCRELIRRIVYIYRPMGKEFLAGLGFDPSPDFIYPGNLDYMP